MFQCCSKAQICLYINMKYITWDTYINLKIHIKESILKLFSKIWNSGVALLRLVGAKYAGAIIKNMCQFCACFSSLCKGATCKLHRTNQDIEIEYAESNVSGWPYSMYLGCRWEISTSRYEKWCGKLSDISNENKMCTLCSNCACFCA